MQKCGSGRSRPSIGRTAGPGTAITAGTTTTTTPRRRCFHCGTLETQLCVRTCEPAGEMRAEKLQREKINFPKPAETLKKLPVFSRCHQQYTYGAGHTYSPTPPLSALPGNEYDRPLLPRYTESSQISGPPPQYFGPPQSSSQPTSPGMVQISAAGPGLVWQYGGQQNGLSNADESNSRNINPAKEFSIRIISV